MGRTINTVYNQWIQFQSFPQFMQGVEEITQRDDARTHWRIKVGPATRKFDATITEQSPEEQVTWKSDSGHQHWRPERGVVTCRGRIPDPCPTAISWIRAGAWGACRRLGR
jgi:uncharacterized membrane protein